MSRMPRTRSMRSFIRNEAENTYAAIDVEVGTKRLLSPIPDGFIPDPAYQIITEGTTGRLMVTTAATDVPGWLIRVNRLAQSMTQVDVLRKAGLTGNASTFNYYEMGKLGHRDHNDPLPRSRRQPIYDALGIDHRPDAGDDAHLIIAAMREYLAQATKFARSNERIPAEDKRPWNYTRIGKLVQIHDKELSAIANKRRPFSLRQRDKVYRLYANLPKLV